MPTGARRPDASGRELVLDLLGIVALGIALGVAANLLALAEGPGHGLSWIQQSTQIVKLSDFTPVVPVRPAPVAPARVAPAPPAATAPRVRPPSPLSVAAPVPVPSPATPRPRDAALPVIPDTGAPLEVYYATARRFWDAGAAQWVDARPADEYAAGHVPGAASLPFDDVQKDPARAGQLDTRGRAVVIAYCDGGTCELARELANVLVAAGHRKVLVFTGGLPGWQAEGAPVATGPAAGSAP